jgi:hypothetical protein
MQDIQLRIPVELTAMRIQGRAQVSAEAARQLAIELHAIIAAYRQLSRCVLLVNLSSTTKRPTLSRRSREPPSTSGLWTEMRLLTKAFGCLRGFRPWTATSFTSARFFDRINGTNFADLAGC